MNPNDNQDNTIFVLIGQMRMLNRNVEALQRVALFGLLVLVIVTVLLFNRLPQELKVTANVPESEVFIHCDTTNCTFAEDLDQITTTTTQPGG